MVKVIKKETTNPRARQACKYDVTGLSPAEYDAIIKGLELLEGDQTTAGLLKTLKGLQKEGGTL